MKLVPFILRSKQNGPYTMTRCTLFLAHAGKNLWQTEEPGLLSEEYIQSEYIDPNGFAIQNLWIDKKTGIAYIHIDPTRMSFQDFYTWEEALQKQEKPECWRHFYFIQEKDGSYWWSPKGITESEFPTGESLQMIFERIQSFLDT